MSGIVSVTTTARAHIGFMDPSGRLERQFGSVGVTLDRPRTRVLMGRSDRLCVCGEEAERAERYIKTLASYFGKDINVKLEIAEAIPAHAGLGSGTQLAVAIGAAYAALMGINAEAPEFALALGRGKRSGIGIGAFQTGGVLFDGGRKEDGGVPPILSRFPFPAAWRIVLIFDREKVALHGSEEIKAFERLDAFPESDCAELCRRTVMGLLPAVAEEDFKSFSENVEFLQYRMGQYFAPVQGGHCTSPRVGEVIKWMKEKGIVGVGQTSWGPTGLAFVESEAIGTSLIEEAREKWPASTGLEFELANGLNHGARVQMHDLAEDVVGDTAEGIAGRPG